MLLTGLGIAISASLGRAPKRSILKRSWSAHSSFYTLGAFFFDDTGSAFLVLIAIVAFGFVLTELLI